MGRVGYGWDMGGIWVGYGWDMGGIWVGYGWVSVGFGGFGLRCLLACNLNHRGPPPLPPRAQGKAKAFYRTNVTPPSRQTPTTLPRRHRTRPRLGTSFRQDKTRQPPFRESRWRTDWRREAVVPLVLEWLDWRERRGRQVQRIKVPDGT